MHVEFIVEDSSGATLIQILLNRLFGQSTHFSYRVHAYRGIGKLPKDLRPKSGARKRILLDQLPKLLVGYAKTPGIDGVVVVLDSDRQDCATFLKELQAVARATGRPDTLFRLAIEEIEAWYLGDVEAIKHAYPRAKMKAAEAYVQDSICGTWELMADLTVVGGLKTVQKVGWPLAGELKHQWARSIGPRLNLETNRSPSFNKFISGVKRMFDSAEDRS